MTGRVTRRSMRIKEALPASKGEGSQKGASPAEEPAAQPKKVKPKIESNADLKVDMKAKVKKVVTPAAVVKKVVGGDTTTTTTTPVVKPRGRRSPPAEELKEMKISRELKEAMASLKRSEKESKRFNMDEIKQLNKDFSNAITKAKRETEAQELKHSGVKMAKTTRSGLRRGAPRATMEYTEGKYINIGMDAVHDTFDKDELEYLEREVRKVKQVKNLKFEHLKYLIHYVLYEELKGIRTGEVQSDFHDRYKELVGESKKELQSEIRTSLYTNEQRDYISGYLQELFEGTKKGPDGGIQHNEINYIETVLLYEVVVRIVKFVHEFESLHQTLAFMKSKSFEAYGISDEEDNDDGGP